MSKDTTHAKGLEGVVAAETRLSDVRGEEGVLIYAGYDINELAGKTTFEEVVHLLHENRLPNRKELEALKRTLASYRTLPPKVVDILRALPKETPPMHAVRTGISALGCFDPHADNTGPGEHKTQALRLIAQRRRSRAWRAPSWCATSRLTCRTPSGPKYCVFRERIGRH